MSPNETMTWRYLFLSFHYPGEHLQKNITFGSNLSTKRGTNFPLNSSSIRKQNRMKTHRWQISDSFGPSSEDIIRKPCLEIKTCVPTKFYLPLLIDLYLLFAQWWNTFSKHIRQWGLFAARTNFHIFFVGQHSAQHIFLSIGLSSMHG